MTPEERIAHMTPYYSQDGITIYNAPWEDVWASLGLAHKDVALLWADPPYGINYQHGGRANGPTRKIAGDDTPFDPAPLLLFPRRVLWGANNYAHLLPPSQDWWTWDKREGSGAGPHQADCELAWTNLGGLARVFGHMWSGGGRASETGFFVHPTQKPVALSMWGFQRAKLQRGDLVFSPYLGSGPEARAALDMGLRLVGCEIVEAYCAAAVSRLRQRPLFAEGV